MIPFVWLVKQLKKREKFIDSINNIWQKHRSQLVWFMIIVIDDGEVEEIRETFDIKPNWKAYWPVKKMEIEMMKQLRDIISSSSPSSSRPLVLIVISFRFPFSRRKKSTKLRTRRKHWDVKNQLILFNILWSKAHLIRNEYQRAAIEDSCDSICSSFNIIHQAIRSAREEKFKAQLRFSVDQCNSLYNFHCQSFHTSFTTRRETREREREKTYK